MVFERLVGSKSKALETRFTTFAEQLHSAFGRIKSDMTETNSKVNSTEKDINNLKLWIAHLNRQNMLLDDQNRHLSQKITDLHDKNSKLHTSHSELLASHYEVKKGLENHSEGLKAHKTEVSDHLKGHSEKLKNALESQNLTSSQLERLHKWVDFFQKTIDDQKMKESALKAELASLRDSVSKASLTPSEHIEALRGDQKALKGHIESISHSIESLRSALQNTQLELKNTQNSVDFVHKKVESETSELKKSLEQPRVIVQPQVQQVSAPPQEGFERHIISRVMPNRKGYILKYIMDLAAENRFSTKEVEEIVVKEKRLCGRTSFYAYLKELKFRNKIGYANIDERSVVVTLENPTQQ